MKSGKTNAFISQSVLLKAFGHKYIRRIPKKSGKGFWYIYKETFKKPFQALAQIFGIKKAAVSENYKAQNIERDYGASQAAYAAHVLEYFTNREKWDTLFAKEENRKKYRKPQKPKAKAGGARKTGAGKKRSSGGREKKPTDDAIRVNRSLMYRVWKTYGSGAKSEERSRATEGNGNAKKDGAEAAVGASKPQTDEETRREKEETGKARKEAGLPPVREDLGQRVSVIDDVTQKGEKEDATARKETALERIREAGAKKERLHETDIDWEAIEDGSGAAKEVITKANVFGQVDWNDLRSGKTKGNMKGGAAFLIDKVYEAIAEAPQEDTPEARRAYVNGINSLRNRLENTPAVQSVRDVQDVLEEIRKEKNGHFVADLEKDPEFKKWQDELDVAATAREEAYAGYKKFLWQTSDEAKAAQEKFADAKERHQAKEKEYYEWISKKNEEAAQTNPISKAWQALGEKFANILDGRDIAFESHTLDAERGEHNRWEWAEKYGVAPIKGGYESHFARNVAPLYKRTGGRNIAAKSTEEIRQLFNLRGISYGDWVLKELSTAQSHVKMAAEGFADLADITGIPDKLISLNGRVALAIGASDQKNTYAHYSPSRREININKMDGGGSLAHEWFHAFDNLIMDAMGSDKGSYTYFMTNNYFALDKREAAALKEYLDEAEGSAGKSKAREKCKELGVQVPETPTEEHQIKVAQAFEELSKAMIEGDAEQTATVFYEWSDSLEAEEKIREGKKGIGGAIYRAGDFDAAVKVVYEKSKSDKERAKWLKLAAAHYFGADKRYTNIKVNTGEKMTAFLADAKDMDSINKKTYWASTHEMAARAFEAYVVDKLTEQGRRNDYLVRNMGNGKQLPQGEERKRINAAFDKLFRVIAETNAIRKALAAVAKRKRWLWVDGNGKIWTRKSVLKAWKKAMSEK